MALSYTQPSVNHDLLRSGGRRAKKQNLALIEQCSEQKRRQVTQLGTIKLNIIVILLGASLVCGL
jgi:hypothetical protein